MSKIIHSHANWLSINKIYPYAVVGILLLAVSLRLIGLDKGIWIDEDYTIGIISNKSLWEMLKELREDVHPPLHYVLLYLWSKINSSQEFLRLLSVFFGISTVIIIMRWIKQYSTMAGLLAGIYLAITPIMLRFSQEIRGYSLLVLATAITFFFASSVINKPEKPLGYIGLTLGLVVAVSTHLIGIMLFLPIVFFIISLSILEQQKIYWNKIIFTFTIPFLIFIYFNFFFLNNLSQKTDVWWMPTFSLYLFSSTFQYLFGFLSLYFSSYLEHLIAFVFLGILTIALILGKSKPALVLLVSAIIFNLEIIIYSIFNQPIFWYRNLLPIFIPFTGFLFLQIATIRAKRIKITALVLLTFLSLIFTANWLTIEAYRPVEYYKQVAQLVETKWQPNDLVVFYPGYIANTVKYHFKKIPKEAELIVWDTNNLENIKSDINEQLANIDRQKLTTIFLISRVDLSIKQEEFENLLSVIKSEFKKQLKVKSFSIISHDFSFININNSDKLKSFSKALEVEFGQPIYYQDKKAYVLSEYEKI